MSSVEVLETKFLTVNIIFIIIKSTFTYLYAWSLDFNKHKLELGTALALLWLFNYEIPSIPFVSIGPMYVSIELCLGCVFPWENLLLTPLGPPVPTTLFEDNFLRTLSFFLDLVSPIRLSFGWVDGLLLLTCLSKTGNNFALTFSEFWWSWLKLEFGVWIRLF